MKLHKKFNISTEDFWNKVEEMTGSKEENGNKDKFIKMVIIAFAIMGILYIINGIRLLVN